jgi:hypothetical protein
VRYRDAMLSGQDFASFHNTPASRLQRRLYYFLKMPEGHIGDFASTDLTQISKQVLSLHAKKHFTHLRPRF